MDQGNPRLQGIIEATDQFRQARIEIEADPPAARILFGAVGSVVFGIISWACGLGAIASAAAFLYPLAGVLIACDAISIPLTIASWGTMWNGLTGVREYGRSVNEWSRQVESEYVQLPFTDQN